MSQTSTSVPRPGSILSARSGDAARQYVAAGLTPARLAQILRQFDDGWLDAGMQLFEQIEERDPHLYSVAQTRRLALTGAPWRITSAADHDPSVGRELADQAADYCRRTARGLDDFDTALAHLSLALGRNIAAAELIWQVDRQAGGHRLVAIEPVAFTQLTYDVHGQDAPQLRVLLDSRDTQGVPLPQNKFIVHSPHAISGVPMRGGLLRVSSLAYLGKAFAIKDWLIFAEVFGMPVRIARYEPNATADEKGEMLDMLTRLGADAVGIFSKAVELQFAQPGSSANHPPYEALTNFFNRELSKAWLGQTLTAETTGSTGTYAAARVHDQVRRDLLRSDAAAEARTIRRDLFTPLVRLRFGDEAVSSGCVPYFERQLSSPPDPLTLARLTDIAVNRLGARVPTTWLHESLGIPEATDQAATILPGAES
jgi:phage gp29-like protein